MAWVSGLLDALPAVVIRTATDPTFTDIKDGLPRLEVLCLETLTLFLHIEWV